MKAVLWAGAAVLLLVAVSAEAEVAVHIPSEVPMGFPMDATIEGLHVDVVRDVVYTAHFEGVVGAYDRNTGDRIWKWAYHTDAEIQGDGSPWQGTRGNAIDMTADDDRLYVAFIGEEDSIAQPVVAIDKDTAKAVWLTDPQAVAEAAGYVPPFQGAPALDPYSVAIDRGSDDGYLYVGIYSGIILKLDRTDGMPVVAGEQPDVFIPAEADVPVSPRPTATNNQNPFACSRESRITTLDVHDGTLWAARNWGGADKQFQCFRLLSTSVNNTLYFMRTSDWDGFQNLALPPTDQVAGNPTASPGILDIELAPSVSGSGHDVYFSGAASGSSGYIGSLHDLPWDPTTVGALFLGPQVFTFHDEDLVDPGPNDVNLTVLGPGTIIRGIAVDPNAVYAVTDRNNTQFFGGVTETAWALKLDRQSLQPIEGPNGWIGTDVQGERRPARSFEPGDNGAKIVLPSDGGNAWIGHADGTPPFAGVGPHMQPGGALLLEVPRDNSPVAIWLLSNGGQTSNGALPVGYVTDFPQRSTPDLQATVYYREETPQETGPWKPLEGLVHNAVPANTFILSNNVLLPDAETMPDSTYRFKVRVSDGERIYEDASDGITTIDRTPPELEIISPAGSNAILTTDRPRFEVALSDTFSGIDTTTTGLWIDDMNRGYPFLEYQTDNAGRITGFVLDLAEVGANDPRHNGVATTLAQGQHTVRVEAWDLAGNFVFEQWVIEVDTAVRDPVFHPKAGVWQASTQPLLTAQFFEDGIQLLEATLAGKDVTDHVIVFPQHPAQNPTGTRLSLVPPMPLAELQSHDWILTVQDRAGNVAGPLVHSVRVDATAPTIGSLSPAPDTLIAMAQPLVSFSIADDGSGIAFDTLHVSLDGFSMADKLPKASQDISFRPNAPLADGMHEIQVRVEDVAGNQRVEAWSFRVDRSPPLVQLSVVFPDGQTALKRGDEVLLRAQVQDASPIESVVVNARGLASTMDASTTMEPVPGRPGTYERVVVVDAGRTRMVEVQARAVDASGNAADATAKILVDNQAPTTFMKDLPRFVSGSFVVSWTNEPDDSIGGSGISHYILERQEEGSPWRVVHDHLSENSYRASYSESTETTLRFRVTAVDLAGNVQPAPSNTVETRAKGDPFESLQVAERLRVGQTARFTAHAVDNVDLQNSTALVRLVGPNGTYEHPLQLTGRVFAGQWNMTIPPGPYTLYFEYRDAHGWEALSAPRAATVLPEVQSLSDAAPAKDSPLPFLLPAALAAAWLRRRL